MNSENILPEIILFFVTATFWPAIFIAFYIKERECRSKLLQLICGMNKFIYWITSYLFDFTIFFFIISLLLTIVAIYGREQFSTFEDLSKILLIFGFYGISMLPFLYFSSYFFEKPSSGETFVPLSCCIRKL